MAEHVGVPYIKGSSTSKAAAKTVKAGNQRKQAWDYIHSQGLSGATAQEVNTALGIKHGCCTRVTELVRLGRIRRIERTRATSTGRQAKIHVAISPEFWEDKRPGWPTPRKIKEPDWKAKYEALKLKYELALEVILEERARRR